MKKTFLFFTLVSVACFLSELSPVKATRGESENAGDSDREDEEAVTPPLLTRVAAPPAQNVAVEDAERRRAGHAEVLALHNQWVEHMPAQARLIQIAYDMTHPGQWDALSVMVASMNNRLLPSDKNRPLALPEFNAITQYITPGLQHVLFGLATNTAHPKQKKAIAILWALMEGLQLPPEEFLAFQDTTLRVLQAPEIIGDPGEGELGDAEEIVPLCLSYDAKLFFNAKHEKFQTPPGWWDHTQFSMLHQAGLNEIWNALISWDSPEHPRLQAAVAPLLWNLAEQNTHNSYHKDALLRFWCHRDERMRQAAVQTAQTATVPHEIDFYALLLNDDEPRYREIAQQGFSVILQNPDHPCYQKAIQFIWFSVPYSPNIDGLPEQTEDITDDGLTEEALAWLTREIPHVRRLLFTTILEDRDDFGIDFLSQSPRGRMDQVITERLSTWLCLYHEPKETAGSSKPVLNFQGIPLDILQNIYDQIIRPATSTDFFPPMNPPLGNLALMSQEIARLQEVQEWLADTDFRAQVEDENLSAQPLLVDSALQLVLAEGLTWKGPLARACGITSE